MTDLLVRQALVVDGSGRPAYTADVAVREGRIEAIGSNLATDAARVMDAGGRVLCPGFIDMHNHIDTAMPDHAAMTSMVRQGVTSAVTGNCGLSPFPNGDPPDPARPFTSMGAFAEAVDGLLGANIVPLLGHGSVRAANLVDASQAASDEEQARMRDAIADAMASGVAGLSTGLIYDPGKFSTTAELIDLARIVGAHGGFYASHIRGEGDTLVDAVSEAIEIGERANVAVHISHHKAKRRRNWGTVATTLAMIDDAIDAGIDVTLDCYPYTASGTTLWSFMPAVRRQADFRNLQGGLPRALRETLLAELEALYPGSSSTSYPTTDLSDVVLGRIDGRFAGYQGVGIDEAARAEGQSTADFVITLLSGGDDVSIIDNAMSGDDMRRVFAHPRCMVGSDAGGWDADVDWYPHPRNYGTFPRFLTGVAKGWLSLEESIRKCTGLPADRLGWRDRGTIAVGAIADILVFDLDQFTDHATFSEPKQYSTGIDLMLVGGVFVVDQDVQTRARPGAVLLRKSATV